MIRDEAGLYQVRFADGLAAATQAKRLATAVVRRELRALGLDGRRVAAEASVSAPDWAERQAAIGTPAAPPAPRLRDAMREEIDLAELEKFEQENRVLQFAG